MSAKGWAIVVILIFILIYDPKIVDEIVNAIVHLLNGTPKAG